MGVSKPQIQILFLVYMLIKVSYVVIIWLRNLSPSRSYLRMNTSEAVPRAAFSSVESSLGTHLALPFDKLKCSFMIVCTAIVVGYYGFT